LPGERLGLQFQGMQLRTFPGLRRDYVETGMTPGSVKPHGDDVTAFVEPAERYHRRRAVREHHQRLRAVDIVLGPRVFGGRKHLRLDVCEILAEQPPGLVNFVDTHVDVDTAAVMPEAQGWRSLVPL